MTTPELKTIAFIFARGGSKGLPGKNIKLLDGKPLIAYSIEVAKTTPGVETVIVSTDDAVIAEVASAHGAEVPFIRPAELAGDLSPEWMAWRHAVQWVQTHKGHFDIFVSIPPTSPFRAVEDIQACIETLKSDPYADMVITVAEANRSPYFNMVVQDSNGYVDLVIQPTNNVFRRQDVPEVFDITTVAYASRPEFIMTAERIFSGKVKSVTVPKERSLDIDTPFDFMIAEAIAAIRKRQ